MTSLYELLTKANQSMEFAENDLTEIRKSTLNDPGMQVAIADMLEDARKINSKLRLMMTIVEKP